MAIKYCINEQLQYYIRNGDLGLRNFNRTKFWVDKCLERLEKKSRCKFQVSTSTLLKQAASEHPQYIAPLFNFYGQFENKLPLNVDL